MLTRPLPRALTKVARYRTMFGQWDKEGKGVISPKAFTSVMRVVSQKQGKPFSERKVRASQLCLAFVSRVWPEAHTPPLACAPTARHRLYDRPLHLLWAQ